MEVKDPAAAPLLSVRGLEKRFRARSPGARGARASIRAVDGVSFDIAAGETFGLVGESGCGKSTAARTIVRLYEPDGGSIALGGEDITRLSRRELLPLRRRFQMVFQDPYASLDPRMTVREILSEPLEAHFPRMPRSEMDDRVYALLAEVGLSAEQARRYPHEFSGGQRQRVGIARALAVRPELIVCDEAISALDVSIQAQIVNMLRELRERTGVAYLFIAHDLSMVKYLSDRVGVMYLGKLVEVAPSEALYAEPLHPYTRGLLAAIPAADPRAAEAGRGPGLAGEVPSPVDPPSGCRFRTRCPECRPRCAEAEPGLADLGGGRLVACHFAGGRP